MKLFQSVLLTLLILLLPLGLLNVQAGTEAKPATYSGHPTFSIVKVVKDVSVTIRTKNLPPGDAFQVRMNKIGTKGKNGIVAGSFSSGAGGAQEFTFNIPEELKGRSLIAIRFDSTTGSGYFAYNWFYNKSSGGVTQPTDGYKGFPTFIIVSVVRDDTVMIETRNLPANDEFTVRMNKMGTRGVGGIKVGSFSSGSGGIKTFTFDIPAEFHGLKQIAIRFDSATGSGYFAYNWFFNATTK